MKISGNKPPDSKDVYVKAPQGAKGDSVSQKGAADRVGVADRVEVSGKAAEIAELKGIISGMPDVRTDKVEAVTKSLANGTYRVDPGKIAGKMIDEIV